MSQEQGAVEWQALSYSVERKTLLNQVSGRFQGGRIHVILGQNGAGKTTLLRCLSGELTAQTGEIQFAGRRLSDWRLSELAQHRAVLAQHQELAFPFNVEELVCMGFDVQQGAIALTSEHKEAVLAACDLLELRERDYLTLSGGEQKRAQLARVLAQIWPQDLERPDAFAGKWLFLDEWSAGLDLKHQVRIGGLLKKWSRKGLGVVMVLHDLNQALQLADDCLILKAGRSHSQGSVETVMNTENLQDALEVRLTLWRPEPSAQPVMMPAE